MSIKKNSLTFKDCWAKILLIALLKIFSTHIFKYSVGLLLNGLTLFDLGYSLAYYYRGFSSEDKIHWDDLMINCYSLFSSLNYKSGLDPLNLVFIQLFCYKQEFDLGMINSFLVPVLVMRLIVAGPPVLYAGLTPTTLGALLGLGYGISLINLNVFQPYMLFLFLSLVLGFSGYVWVTYTWIIIGIVVLGLIKAEPPKLSQSTHMALMISLILLSLILRSPTPLYWLCFSLFLVKPNSPFYAPLDSVVYTVLVIITKKIKLDDFTVITPLVCGMLANYVNSSVSRLIPSSVEEKKYVFGSSIIDLLLRPSTNLYDKDLAVGLGLMLIKFIKEVCPQILVLLIIDVVTLQYREITTKIKKNMQQVQYDQHIQSKTGKKR